jgi:hypothetical protein
MSDEQKLEASLQVVQQIANEQMIRLAAKGHPAWTMDQLKAIDQWIARQNERDLDRSEAVRRLVEIGLAGG